MCGRYSLTSPPEVIAERFRLVWTPGLDAHYNIAPSQMIPVIRETKEGRVLTLMKWGLVPSWAKDPSIGERLINARAETIADKPSFRSAYRKRHCLIPADSFFEWKPGVAHKQPYCIHMADHQPFGMGGLWEHWTGPGGEVLETCTIITTQANTLVGQLHDRMPVIIQPADYSSWLEGNAAEAERMLQAVPSELMGSYPVSTHVNRAANDDAECLKPVLLRE